jgi:hypothetical protein
VLGRAKPKSYGQLTRAELGQTFAHLRAATGHAGAGAASIGAARLRGGRDALAPLVEAARTEARRANRAAARAGRRRSKRVLMSRNWSLALGALGTTAAVGVGAYAVRRRRGNAAAEALARGAWHSPDAVTGAPDVAASAAGRGATSAPGETVPGPTRNATEAVGSASDKPKNVGPGDRRVSKPLEQTIG